jgi:TPR repeat protein
LRSLLPDYIMGGARKSFEELCPMNLRFHFILLGCATITACGGAGNPAPPLAAAAQPPRTCSAEAPDVCLAEGSGGVWDEGTQEAALRSLQLACATDWTGRPRACTLLAMHSDAQEPETMRRLDELCAQGEQMACAWWGMNNLSRVFGAATSPEIEALRGEVLARLDPACAAATTEEDRKLYGINVQGLACNSLAPLYEHGLGVARNDEKAFELWARSCQSGDPHGCAQVGFFTMRGLGTPKDEVAGREIYERACEKVGGAMACANLAHLYMEGDGVETDYARAASLFERACRERYLNSCEQQKLAEDRAKQH